MTVKRNITTFFIISILGTLGHFVYEWSGKVYSLGLFFPVNESTWEHLKLLFFPALIFLIIEYFTLENRPKNFIFAWTIGIFAGMLGIVVLFYTYRGVIGKNIDFINIAIYFLGVIITLAVRQIIIKNHSFNSGLTNIISIASLIVMAVLFTGFSFNPPSLGIFLPPSV